MKVASERKARLSPVSTTGLHTFVGSLIGQGLLHCLLKHFLYVDAHFEVL